MARSVSSLEPILRAIEGRGAPGRTRLVAIDGFGGAGKSSLAAVLRNSLENARIVQADDFWLPRAKRPGRERVIAEPGSDYDWPRLRDEVVAPLAAGREGAYRRYDWLRDRTMERHLVPSGGTTIVEGVFVLRRELCGFYDSTIWVDTPREVRLLRGIARDGEKWRELWENEWEKAYEHYGAIERPWERADFVVSGEDRAPARRAGGT